MMNWAKRFSMLLLVAQSFVSTAGEITLTSVTAQQRYPWNGLVDIAVTMEGSADDVAEAVCWVAVSNSVTGAAVPITSVTQNGGDTCSGTTWTRRFIWNTTNDVGAVKIDDLALTVRAGVSDVVQLWENGPYWAKCNVGAMKPEEYGYYFWWGDTVGYKRKAGNDGWVPVKNGSSFSFLSGNCPTYGKSIYQLRSAGYTDSTDNLVAAYDAATAHLGAPWRMPTDAEFSALVSNCTTVWTTRNGVYGRLITGRGAYALKSIFLPAAGYGNYSYLSYAGSYGYYWSSNPNSDDSGDAESVCVDSSRAYRICCSRVNGYSVRPVREFSEDGTSAIMKSGVTTHLTLDCRPGVRTYSVGGEKLWFDANWSNSGDEVRIVDNGVVLTKGISGTYIWKPESWSSSLHEVRLEILSAGKVVAVETVEFAQSAEVNVASVTAQQRYPWNGMVDIVVTMEGSSNAVNEIVCNFVATNSVTKSIIPVVSITQVGPCLGSGSRWMQRFLWNATNDVGLVKIDDIVLSVDIKPLSGVQLWENGPYWAECNVGASNPEGYGYYFWWGDTIGYKRNVRNDGWISVKDGVSYSFSSGNCPTYGKDNAQLQSEGYIDSTGNLVAAHDAATAYLGAPWRMPTDAEFSALVSNCTILWTRGYGTLVTGKGDYASKSVFFPANGGGYGSSLSGEGTDGNYWASTPYSSNMVGAGGIIFPPSTKSDNLRYYGWSVRPVREFVKRGELVIVNKSATTHLKLDCLMGVRECSVEGENLQFDAGWYEKCTEVRITDDGVVLTNGVKGACVWRPPANSSEPHLLKLEALSQGQVIGCEMAQFALGYVRDLKVCQLWPHNKVALDFMVAEDIGEVMNTNETLFVWCANAGRTNLATRILGNSLAWAGKHRILWDIESEGLRFANAETIFGVSVEHPLGGVQLWENGPYWAECNVGASKPEEYGDYFWWGDTDGYRRYPYDLGWASSTCMTENRYKSGLEYYGYIDSTGNLVAEHDAATAHLGAPWRMPTKSEFSALFSNCTTRWTKRNGVYGCLVAGKGTYSSKAIFLPAAGYVYDGSRKQATSYGYYWSSTPYASSSATYIEFWEDNFRVYYLNVRSYGQSIRPVRDLTNRK